MNWLLNKYEANHYIAAPKAGEAREVIESNSTFTVSVSIEIKARDVSRARGKMNVTMLKLLFLSPTKKGVRQGEREKGRG